MSANRHDAYGAMVREARALRTGAGPSATPADQFGEWQTFADRLRTLETPQAVTEYLATHTRLPGVQQLLDDSAPLSQAAPVASVKAAGGKGPPLPDAAQAVNAHLAPCGHWMRHYVEWARAAAPMTPDAFHEAAALIAASMAVARRLAVGAGAGFLHPNLYLLFVSPSTIDHKSTGLKALQTIIRGAGMTHLLMPHKGTPQALVADLDHHKLPSTRSMRDLEAFLLRRAFAPQRGWIREEASALFASLKQEFNAGLLELILELYDCPESYEEITISRGDVRIERAYLSFFGVSTPVEMAPHFANLAFWSNGLWARIPTIMPDAGAPRPFVFFPETPPDPGAVASGLRRIYELFPAAVATLDKEADASGNDQPAIMISNLQPPALARLAPGVLDAWAAYSEATGHTLLHAGAVEQELWACYGRFGTLAIKVAMLLAAMDAAALPVTIELRHYARAQQIVEGWREHIHRLWSDQSATNETRLMERILERLRKHPRGVTVRDLCAALRQPAKDISEALNVLAEAGRVASTSAIAGNGRAIKSWAEAHSVE